VAGDVDTEVGGLRDTVALISRATVMEVAISKNRSKSEKKGLVGLSSGGRPLFDGYSTCILGA
jgi:hypothetical protein